MFLAVSLLLGWFEGWAWPRMFPKETKFGFAYGLLHGAMSPLALPTLVMGRDVEMFGANNTGRGYKIGYICGINLCGLIFFGSAFWKPGQQSSHRRTHDCKAGYKDKPTG